MQISAVPLLKRLRPPQVFPSLRPAHNRLLLLNLQHTLHTKAHCSTLYTVLYCTALYMVYSKFYYICTQVYNILFKLTHCTSLHHSLFTLIHSKHSKSGSFCAVTILRLKTLRRKMAKKSLNMPVEWVKMVKKVKKKKKKTIVQLAHTNLKILCKVRKILHCRTTVRRWHLVMYSKTHYTLYKTLLTLQHFTPLYWHLRALHSEWL